MSAIASYVSVVPVQTIEERIEEFCKYVNAQVAARYKEAQYVMTPPVVHPKYAGKWCHIHNFEERNGVLTCRSIHSFIALQDFKTKFLGQIKRGDIHKPATFKAPAKHARGSVFSLDFDKCVQNGFVVYMR